MLRGERTAALRDDVTPRVDSIDTRAQYGSV